MDNNVSDENVDEMLHEYYTEIKILKRGMINRNDECKIEDSKVEKNLIDKAIELIDNMMPEKNNMRAIRLKAMKTTLLFERAKMMSSINDEDTAIELLRQCSNDIMSHSDSPFVVYLAMKILNHYAYLHIGCGKYDEAVESLESAGRIYDKYCDGNSKVYFTSEELFLPSFAIPPENRNALEAIVTKNYEMLIHAYHKQKHINFLECYHNVLDKLYKMPNYDHLKWSANVINLAAHFLTKDRFKDARHHLSAATHVLYECEKKLKAERQLQTNTKWMKQRWKMLNRIYTDLTIKWIRYGIHILTVSKNRIIKEMNNDTNQSQKLKVPDIVFGNIQIIYSSNQSKELDLDFNEKLFFTTLDVSDLELQVPANFITCVTHARILFFHTLNWVTDLIDRLSCKEHASDYLNIIFDWSKLYALHAFYESLDAKYEFTKMRIDIIEKLRQKSHKFDPQVWKIVEPLTLHELSKIQLELMQLHLHQLFTTGGTLSHLNDLKFHQISETISNLRSQLYKVQMPSNDMIDPPSIGCDLCMTYR